MFKINKILILLLMVIAVPKVKANSENRFNTSVRIDLNSNTLTSTDGVNIRYGNLKLKVFEIRAEEDRSMVYIPGELFLEVDEATGKLRIDSENGRFSRSGNYGTLGKSFGYIEVGEVTGAENPNDRIYFGGESAKYLNGKTYLKNSWVTTDPKILVNKNLEELGYHLKTETVVIEPNKQVTFLNSNLFIGDTDVIPYSLPWYRLNIRQGSQVPLFPSWGNDTDYGWHITTGVLWGDNKSKYVGGISPKFGDQIGLMIGRMENWYDLGKYGKGQLNIDDWLVYKKADEEETERNFDRWNINYSHNYSGEHGFFDLGYQNVTYNMLTTLDDAIDDYFAGTLNEKRDGNTWKYINGIPDKGESIEFYTLNTELENLGENEDISIKAKVNLVSDKDVYGVLVADKLDSLGYTATVDHDLVSNVEIKKENENYSIGSYYNYLYDMDTGSSRDDMQSRAEDFGFNINDKVNKINIVYDEKYGNKYRKLNSWERDPNFSILDNESSYGIKYDYTPWTVEEYSVYDSKNLKTSMGEYNLYGNLFYKVGYDNSEAEKELNTDYDPFREIALMEGTTITSNIRDVQYNRYENIIYNKTSEERGYVDFRYNSFVITLAGGTTEEEIWDREGIYSNDSYKIYINNSDFYEFGLLNENISLSNLGTLKLFGNIRVDEYDTTNDSSIRYRGGVTHQLDGTYFKNNLTYTIQEFSHDDESGITKDIRLNNKNNIQEVSDKLEFDIFGKKIVYEGSYTDSKKASTDEKNNEKLNQGLNIFIDEDKSIGFEYGFDKRYTDENTANENHNDLTSENYGVNFKYSDDEFYYKNRKIDYSIWNIDGVDDAEENISENIFGYIKSFGDDKLSLTYTRGMDKRYELGEDVIDTVSDGYGVSYLSAGEIERRYTARYENYNNRGNWNKNLDRYDSDVIYLSYTYKDSRFTDEDLVEYAALEYKKTPDELSQEDIFRIREVLEARESSRIRRFNLDRIVDDRTYFGDYKRGLKLSLYMQRNDAKYEETGDFLKSLEDLDASIFYSYNRLGFGYTYSQDSGYTNYKDLNSWKDIGKEHEFSFNMKIGKPSEGWRTKLYIQLYDETDNNRSYIDGLGVEIGKEFGYYEWAVAYERDYSYSTDDYEWGVALQFKLLTFPNMNIFGIGATTDKNKKTSPDTYLFDGIEIESIE